VQSFLGAHNFWQLLTEHSNPILNELIAEMSWDNSSKKSNAKLTLYKRIKPFVTDSQFSTTLEAKNKEAARAVTKLISKFSNVRRVDIPLEDIIDVDAGTNWRDKINFVEIMLDDSNTTRWSQAQMAQIRQESQEMDLEATSREGFKPMILKSIWLPPVNDSSATVLPLEITYWKYILREWYFNTHNMLNGAVSFIGQDEYIGVGDNIRMPAEALGQSLNFNMIEVFQKKPVYLLAHVESISHSLSVGEDGTRHFVSSINFSRGVFVDQNGDILKATHGSAVDSKASLMNSSEESLQNVTIVPKRRV
jgi:hypothetical protein